MILLLSVTGVLLMYERQITEWADGRYASNLPPGGPHLPVEALVAAAVTGRPGRPDLRAQLTLDRRSGAVVRWETFGSQSLGRRLRSWGRQVHTGEAGGFLGQTLAGLASAGAAVLVWTGLALAWRRFLPRRQMPAAESEPVATPQISGRAPMKTNGKNRRKAAKKPGKRPSWLAYGAMVSTLGASVWMDKPAWAHRDLIAQAVPAPAGRTGRAQTQETPVLRFDIPAGPLTAVLDHFRRVTGFILRIESDRIAHLASPGVSGLLTPLQALRELLAGTGVTFEPAGSATVTLTLQELTETLDVIDRPAPLAPASPKYTAPRSGAAFRLNGMWTHADVPGRDAVENQRRGLAPSLAFGLGTASRATRTTQSWRSRTI